MHTPLLIPVASKTTTKPQESQLNQNKCVLIPLQNVFDESKCSARLFLLVEALAHLASGTRSKGRFTWSAYLFKALRVYLLLKINKDVVHQKSATSITLPFDIPNTK